MTKVMGIDCSTNSLAFSVFEDQNLVNWGEFSFGKGDILHRINNANRVINAAIAGGIFSDVDKVVFEGAVYVNNRQTVINLAYAFGAAVSPLIKPGVKAESVPAITWQNFIGNKVFSNLEKNELKAEFPGKSASWYKEKMRERRKQRTIDFIRTQFGVDAVNDNVADAIGVGWWGANNGS